MLVKDSLHWALHVNLGKSFLKRMKKDLGLLLNKWGLSKYEHRAHSHLDKRPGIDEVVLHGVIRLHKVIRPQEAEGLELVNMT